MSIRFQWLIPAVAIAAAWAATPVTADSGKVAEPLRPFEAADSVRVAVMTGPPGRAYRGQANEDAVASGERGCVYESGGVGSAAISDLLTMLNRGAANWEAASRPTNVGSAGMAIAFYKDGRALGRIATGGDSKHVGYVENWRFDPASDLFAQVVAWTKRADVRWVPMEDWHRQVCPNVPAREEKL